MSREPTVDDSEGRGGRSRPAGAEAKAARSVGGGPPSPGADRAERPYPEERAARFVLKGLLLAGNLLTAWLLLKSFLVRPPGGRWDQESITAAGVPAMSAHIGSWITGWGTLYLVRLGGIRPWWFAVPIVIGTVSLGRLLILVGK
ncbi:hypothetical protein [Streptomyces sp. NPDC020141]|uniref:hypothetical protein n=1 Tax=Streptomyces sp. NPDC020141 TaxID=3365065 RepID=UPI0037A0393E